MAVGYCLVNVSKKESISFSHLPVSTKNEICSHHVAAKIVSLYMIENIGDEISFMQDQYDENSWNLRVPYETVVSYEDVTDSYIDKAEELGYISGRRKEIFDDDEPEIFVWKFDENINSP